MPGRRTATGKNVNWILMKRNKVLYLFILPAFLYFLIFAYVPMYGVQIAFKDFVANKGFLGSEWADPLFKHFITFFSSVNFWEILRNTIGLSLYYLAISFPMPILLALMINEVKNTRFKKAVQNITYMPYFVSTVVLVGMINLFFSYNGLANNIGALFGAEPQMFLMKDALFNDLYVWSGVWQATGHLHRRAGGRFAGPARGGHHRRRYTAAAYHPHQSAGHYAHHRHHADHGRGRHHEPFL